MSEDIRGLAALGQVADPTSENGVDASALGERIAQARVRRALTGSALGDLVGLGKDQISKIENGRRRVSVRELPAIAEALGVTVGYLLGQPGRPRLAMAHRLAAGQGAESAQRARQRALQLLEAEDVLSRRMPPPPAMTSPAGSEARAFARAELAVKPRNKQEAQRQGRHLAERLRSALGLGSHEIGGLSGLIERNFGVDVAISPLGTEVDGLCLHSEDIALIVASSDYSDGHVRFTLAHELGHHLLNDPRDVIDESERDMFADDLCEKRVNSFAGHLLMPEKGIRETLAWLGVDQVNERVLVALMERFGVSLAALVYQLNVLKLITFDEGRRLRDCRVGDLVARHRDVAPTAAATTVRRAVRAPERLLGTAVRAAQAEQTGLSVVAALLEREDDETLWDQIMEGDSAGAAAGTVS